MSHKKPAPPKHILEHFYIDKKMSLGDLASEFGTSKPTIRRWLKEHGIETRSISEQLLTGKQPTKEEILDLYYNKNSPRSVQYIANRFDVSYSTITRLMDKYNIPRRDKKNRVFKE